MEGNDIILIIIIKGEAFLKPKRAELQDEARTGTNEDWETRGYFLRRGDPLGPRG